MTVESGFKLGYEAPIQVIYNNNQAIFPTTTSYALVSQIIQGEPNWNEIYILSNCWRSSMQHKKGKR